MQAVLRLAIEVGVVVMVLVTHGLAVTFVADHQIVTALLSPGQHVPTWVFAAGVGFFLLRLFVLFWLPALIICRVVLWVDKRWLMTNQQEVDEQPPPNEPVVLSRAQLTEIAIGPDQPAQDDPPKRLI